MTMRSETPVVFECCGFRLFGTLHVPAHGPADTGIVLVNAGPTDRAGPHRLYLEWARRTAEAGYPTLRFDPRGTGESEGEWAEALRDGPVVQLYQQILGGAWQEDARSAIAFLRARTGVQKVLVVGLCGGAMTALAAGATEPAVRGLFLMGTPVTHSTATGRVADLPRTTITQEWRRYLRKLFDFGAWRRFFTFRTDYRTLLAVALSRLRHLRQGAQNAHAPDRRNPLFVERLEQALAAGKRVEFLFAERDFLWQEFQEQVLHRPRAAGRAAIPVTVIREANHTLTEPEWHEQAFQRFMAWVAHPRGETRAGKVA